MKNSNNPTIETSMSIEKFNRIKFLKIRIISDDLAMCTNNRAKAITKNKKIKFANQVANVIFDIAKCETWSEYEAHVELYYQYQRELRSK